MRTCTEPKLHCENCGSTSPEDVGPAALREGDGYTACCNECTATAGDCRGHHLED